MEPDFASELSDLITKHKAKEADLGELVAEMEGAIDGLKTEIEEGAAG